MKGNELVWRTLVDHALQGQRRWTSAADLAFYAGVPTTTTYLALERLDEIGAIDRFGRGGFATVSPDKVLTLMCAARNLKRDTIVKTTVAAIAPYLNNDRGQYALGGADAAIRHLGGQSPVVNYEHHIVYLTKQHELPSDLPAGDEVTVLSLDRRAALDWHDNYASVAQTIADLFATPGWQASEFRLALRDRWMPSRDWNQGGDVG